MGDVVHLPPREELVLVCRCGCQVWFIHEGEFECAACERKYSDPAEEYPVWKVPPDKLPEKLEETNLAHLPVDLVVERFRRSFTGDGQIGIILRKEDSNSTYIADMKVETEEQLDWVRRQLNRVFEGFENAFKARQK